MQKISIVLQSELEKNHLTIYSLAKKAGLTYAGVYQLVNGESKDIKLSTLIKMADVLNISLDEFRERK